MASYRFEPFSTPEAAESALRVLVESADEELLFSGSSAILDRVRPALEDALDRGVLVLLLTSGVEDDRFEDVARVVHVWEDAGPLSVICTADDRDGLCANELVFEEPLNDDEGVLFSHPLVRTHLFSTVIGNTWNRATEEYIGEPDPLPATYRNFPTTVVNATLHLREGRDLDAAVRGKHVGTTEEVTLEGAVCNVRQSFVSPITNSFPVENSLFVRTADDDVVTVGGPGAFVEDVEGYEVTLRER